MKLLLLSAFRISVDLMTRLPPYCFIFMANRNFDLLLISNLFIARICLNPLHNQVSLVLHIILRNAIVYIALDEKRIRLNTFLISPKPYGVFKGWSGGAKVSGISRHRGVQLILAYDWARPAILVAGKDIGECFHFFCFFTFTPLPLSSLSLFFISSTISSVSFLPFSGRRHKMTHKG